jgi:hypothetical protein
MPWNHVTREGIRHVNNCRTKKTTTTQYYLQLLFNQQRDTILMLAVTWSVRENSIASRTPNATMTPRKAKSTLSSTTSLYTYIELRAKCDKLALSNPPNHEIDTPPLDVSRGSLWFCFRHSSKGDNYNNIRKINIFECVYFVIESQQWLYGCVVVELESVVV